MILKRFFDDKAFNKLSTEFSFLIQLISESQGDFDITLGNNHVALYCQGLSISRIEVSIFGEFEVMAPKAIMPDRIRKNKSFNFRESTNGFFAELNGPQLQELFSTENLELFKTHLNQIPQKPEIVFTQSVIQGNQDQQDFMIIDRFVTDGELKGKRMNMVALEKVDEQYHFRICEPCLEANAAAETAGKLQHFVKNVERYINDYKANFETNYKQRRALGLHADNFPEEISIAPKVCGLLLMPSNTGNVEAVQKNFPDLKCLKLPDNFKICATKLR